MIYTLENELIQITVSSFGAELHNITGKKNHTEFLWNGNPKYWKYHAPILFPIVGKVKDDHYAYNEKSYSLPQHGFARLSEFKLHSIEKNKITFELSDSEETLKCYPFRFKLLVSYELSGNQVKVKYRVENRDKQDIFFSIGAHPAFKCPLYNNEVFEDYYLEFEKTETAAALTLDKNTNLISEKKFEILKKQKQLNLSLELFKESALIFYGLQSSSVALKSRNHNSFIKINFKDFPFLALWTKPEGAPFFCIEPWHGCADEENQCLSNFSFKKNIFKLEINQKQFYTFLMHFIE